jgi:hypothetical protein
MSNTDLLSYTAIDTILAFAHAHDWGRHARIVNDAVILTDDDGTTLTFTTLRDIRDWAGY